MRCNRIVNIGGEQSWWYTVVVMSRSNRRRPKIIASRTSSTSSLSFTSTTADIRSELLQHTLMSLNCTMSARRCCTVLNTSSPVVARSHLRTRPRALYPSSPSSRSLNQTHHRRRDGDNSKIDTTPSGTTTLESTGPAIQRFASALRDRSSATAAATEPYAAYGTTEKMYKSCAAAGDYILSPGGAAFVSSSPSSSSPPAQNTTGERPEPLKTSTGEDVCYPLDLEGWHTTYSLPPTFSTWAQLTFLHLHILQLRIRCFPPHHARRWSQNLLDHFFYAAEERMDALHGISMRGVRTKYLKDLFEQRRGAEISYDEGLVKGDAVLAAAVWRNVFQARGDVDARALAEITGWIRRAARGLAKLSDAEFASARWRFGVPWEGREAVERESEGIKRTPE